MVKGLADVHLHKRGSEPLEPREPEGAPGRGQPGRPVFTHGGAKKRWYHKRLRRRDRPTLSFSSPVFEDKYPAAARWTLFADWLQANRVIHTMRQMIRNPQTG